MRRSNHQNNLERAWALDAEAAENVGQLLLRSNEIVRPNLALGRRKWRDENLAGVIHLAGSARTRRLQCLAGLATRARPATARVARRKECRASFLRSAWRAAVV